MKHLGDYPKRRGGFSLVEMIVVIGGIGILIAVGAVALTGNRETARSEKLAQDLIVINSAVRLYQVNGGDFAAFAAKAADSPGEAIDILKRAATEDSAECFAGFTGSFLDARLLPVMQTAAEGATSEERILWNETKKKFVMATSGARGIKEIDMLTDAESATVTVGTEVRTGVMKLAATDKWVWDYENVSTLVEKEGTTGITLNPGMTSTVVTETVTALAEPTFSLPAGLHSLNNYPALVTIWNPNDPTVSTILYTRDGGSWMIYDGSEILIEPDDFLAAFAQSVDPENWTDSEMNEGQYTTIPVELQMAVTGPASVNYGEVGGAMMGGGPEIALVDGATISLVNGGMIPDEYENSGNFHVSWTTNGEDPSDPAALGLNTAPAFTVAFPDQAVDLSLPEWGSQTSFPIKTMAKSSKATILSDSVVATHTVEIDRIQLRAAKMSKKSKEIKAGKTPDRPELPETASEVAKAAVQKEKKRKTVSTIHTVTIDLETGFGDMPVGGRIYYTTDGSDPGDAEGNPVTGMLYVAPFEVETKKSTVEVKARVYGPTWEEHWFEPSATATLVLEDGKKEKKEKKEKKGK